VHQSPNPVNTSITDIPFTIMVEYHDINLAGDIMFVNYIQFVVTIARNLKFATASMISNLQNPTHLLAIKHIDATNAKRGFRVVNICMDGQFDSFHGDLSKLHLTIHSATNNEHVTEIKRFFCKIKERAGRIYNRLTFKH
jgi:hypothetical protein